MSGFLLISTALPPPSDVLRKARHGPKVAGAVMGPCQFEEQGHMIGPFHVALDIATPLGHVIASRNLGVSTVLGSSLT